MILQDPLPRRSKHDPLVLQIQPDALEGFVRGYGTPGLEMIAEEMGQTGLLAAAVYRRPWSFWRRLRFLIFG